MGPGLLCFAVVQEFQPFFRLWQKSGGQLAPFEWPGPKNFQGKGWFEPGLVVIITGMGARNAEEVGRQALLRWKPSWLVTSGFAGGLNRDWPRGSLIMSADPADSWRSHFSNAGFRPGQLTCQPRIAVTREEKAAIAARVHADAVEMESAVLQRMAIEQGVPSLTARVISDDWEEDLPLDFEKVLDDQQRIHAGKLALTLALRPSKIPALAAFGRRTQASAQVLATALVRALTDRRKNDRLGLAWSS